MDYEHFLTIQPEILAGMISGGLFENQNCQILIWQLQCSQRKLNDVDDRQLCTWTSRLQNGCSQRLGEELLCERERDNPTIKPI